jgi:predicted acylesterase/phospholipase RssA
MKGRMSGEPGPNTTTEGSDGRPFGAIGLSLSGGGFRAAAFHLGTLDALHRLGLLEDVAVLSTVSGGSFPGAAYALACSRGQAFERFFADLHAFLARNDLPARALAAFRGGRPQTPSPARSLVKAVAQALDEGLFAGARFGELLAARTHLAEVVLNATEFRSGVPFRFRASSSSRVRIGNGNVWVTRAQAARLRLADVVAASACFPGGFEPLVLPEDFNWSAEAPTELPADLEQFAPVALMDGGITDNQGVSSVRLADRGQELDLGLVVISDTDRAAETLYEPGSRPPSRGPRLWQLGVGAAALGLAFAASGVGLLAEAVLGALDRGGPAWTADLLLRWIPALACLGLAGGLAGGWLALRRALVARLPRSLHRPTLAALGGLTLGEASHLVRVRLRSLLALTNHVFTRRIRRQVFDAAYEDLAFRERLVANLVYRLPRAPQAEPCPSPALLAVAVRASRMPTTLWFERPGQLDDLVATGQATLCHALLAHLQRLGALTPAQSALRERLLALWQRLDAEPHCLLELSSLHSPSVSGAGDAGSGPSHPESAP